MKERWQQLNKREQLLTASMMVFVLVFLFYNLVWQPLNANIAKTEKKLASQQALLTWVNDQTALLKYSAQSSQGVKSSGSLTSIVNRTARNQQLVITRIQPKGDEVQIWIDQAIFSNLLQWLSQLALAEGIYVKSIDLSNTEQAGIVKVRGLLLGRN